jgi:hypothetical protein
MFQMTNRAHRRPLLSMSILLLHLSLKERSQCLFRDRGILTAKMQFLNLLLISCQ